MGLRLCEVIVRKSDGSVFEPSTPDGYTEVDAFRDMLSGKLKWYFRQLRWEKSPWWKFWTCGRWARTGEIWQPKDGSEFDVTDLR